MNWIIEHIPEINSRLAICLYWLPLLTCAIGYAHRTYTMVQTDLKERAEAERKERSYYPEIRVGTLIGFLASMVTPVVNVWCALFDITPSVFTYLDKLLNFPLVPSRRERERGAP